MKNRKSRKPAASSSRRLRKPTRLCRCCGKNAHPNYFFCPTCHHKISYRDEPEDLVPTGFSDSRGRPPA